MDARVHTGLFNRLHFDPPYTRSKYLSYFRPLSYGEAAVDRHGGVRRVDMKTAEELTSLYQRQHAADGLPVAMSVEDDVRTRPCAVFQQSVLAPPISVTGFHTG